MLNIGKDNIASIENGEVQVKKNLTICRMPGDEALRNINMLLYGLANVSKINQGLQWIITGRCH